MSSPKPKPVGKITNNDIARFHSKYDVGKQKDCWEWKGTTNSTGLPYGQFHINKRKTMAHRVAYAIHHKKEPGRKLVRHKCDNPRCVNPRHLIRGTHVDNMSDMYERKRQGGGQAKGSKSGKAKLTEDTVLLIRYLRSRNVTCRLLSKLMNVNESTISEICTGTSWKHVGGPISIAFDPTRLSRKQVKEIHARARSGELFKDIAPDYGVKPSRIWYECKSIGIKNTPKGERQGSAKVTEAQVREMRRIKAEQGLSYDKLTKLFPLSRTCIADIITRKSWRHVK